MIYIPCLIDNSKITQVGNEFVFLPDCISEDCIVGLANETASFIVKYINGQNSIDLISEKLCEIYDIEIKDSINIVTNFITMLIDKGICKWKIIQ